MIRVLLIGTGRAALHLGHAWVQAGADVVGVAGRFAVATQALAQALRTDAFALGAPLPTCDLRVIAVSDDAIAAVAAQLPTIDAVTAHVSGTRSLELLGDHRHRGVLWPIQSLGGADRAGLLDAPIVIDGDDTHALEVLRRAASLLSHNVEVLPQEQRITLHLAAVLAGNFPVALLRAAHRLLADNGIEPTLVDALWRKVTAKAVGDPDGALTGPARRGDLGTIDAHLDRLADAPDLRTVYAALSQLVLREFHPQQHDL